MKRLFLILLLMTMILLSAAVQEAAGAFPGGEEKFLGLIPMWDLRVSLPCGVFAAAEAMVAMGVGAQVLLSARRLRGKTGTSVDSRLVQLVYCSLWCGWTLIACCTQGFCYIIPGIGTPQAYDLQVYQYFAIAGAGVMLICFIMDTYLRGRMGFLPGVLALAFAVAAGYLWHGGYTTFLLLSGFACAGAFSLRELTARWPKDKSWLLPCTLGVVLSVGYLLHLHVESGRTVDAALVVSLLITLAAATGLSVLRLTK